MAGRVFSMESLVRNIVQRKSLTGDRVCLRDVRLSDVEGEYAQWINDPEVLKYTESRFRFFSQERLREYVTSVNENNDLVFLAITLRESGRHIGNIKLGPIDWNHRFGDIGLIIGAKDCWGQGYASESIRLLAKFAFTSLKLHKLTAGCYAVNSAAIKAFEKAGFMREGLRHSQYLCEERYVDLVCLGLLDPADPLRSH
jgi:RimJ/RimL family protein N-acetyltransferase